MNKNALNWTRKSQVRALMLVVSIIVLLSGLVFAFTITDAPPTLIVINETDLYTFDANVSINETNVTYQTTVNDDIQPSTGYLITDYFSLDSETGLITINIIPRFFLGADSDTTFQDQPGGVSFFLIATNKSNEYSQLSSFKIRVLNVNEPPQILSCLPDPTGTSDGCDPDNSDRSENMTYTFNVTYQDLDPGTWADVDATWYLEFDGNLQELTGSPVHNSSYSCSSPDNFTECSINFGLSSAGPYNLTVELEDNNSVNGLVTNVTWSFDVLNINRSPYFTANETIPGDSGLYNGRPIIQIDELQNAIIRVNYTDDDDLGSNLQYENYQVTALYYINGSLNETDSDYNKFSEFYFNTTLSTVLGGRNSTLFPINITITDGGLYDYALWYINVSNVDADPTIDSLSHDNESGFVAVTEGENVTVFEGYTSTLRFSYSDLDNNLDSAVIRIDGTPVLTESPANKETDQSSQTRAWTFSEAGSYNVSFFVNDTNGNNVTSWYYVDVLDNTAPIITSFIIENSSFGYDFFEGDSVTITVTYEDNESNAANSVQDYFIKLNGTNQTGISRTSSQISKTINFNYMSAGPYNISTQICDDEGLCSQLLVNDSIFINPVEIPPQVEFITYDNITPGSSYPFAAPYSSNGLITSWEGEQVSFNARFIDLNGNATIDTIELREDGSFLNRVVGTQQMFYDYDLDFSQAGTKNITFFVNDSEGNNITEWFELAVTDNTAPNITSLIVHNGTDITNTFTENSTIYINFTFNDTFNTIDKRNMDEWSITIDQLTGGSDFHDLSVSGVGIDSFSASHNFSFTSEGTYNITAFINDTQGLFSEAFNENVVVVPNEQAPEITSFNVTYANGTKYTDVVSGTQFTMEESNGIIGLNNITIEFSATDINLDLNASSANVFVNGAANSGFTHTELFTFSSQGVYIINISVLDDQGNEANQYINLTVVDNIDPVITNITITNTLDEFYIEETDILKFVVDANDANNNLVNYSLVFNDTRIADKVAQGSNLFVGPTTNYDFFGDYNVTAIVTDFEGRQVNFSKVFTVAYKNQSPEILSYQIDSNEIISASPTIQVFEGKSVDLFVQARDNDSDLDTFGFYYEGSPIAGCQSASVANPTTDTYACSWTPTSGTAGIRNITVSARDLDNLVTNVSYDIEIQQNTVPVVENLTIVHNETGLFDFTEGDSMNISFDYFDQNENYDTIRIIINTSPQIIIDDDNATVYWDFDSRGTYNITAFVNDTFGNFSQISNTSVVIKKREFVPQIVDLSVTERNTTSYAPEFNEVIDIFPNSGKLTNWIDIFFNATDINGNDTITNFNISIENIGVFVGNSYRFNVDFPQTGLYEINVSALDQDGQHNTSTFYINVTQNRPPTIVTNTTLNSSGLTGLYENDEINFTLDTNDLDGNIDTLLIYFNDSVVASTTSSTFLTHTIPLTYTDRGVYDVWFFVNDTNGTFVNNSDTITVLPTNVSPTIDSYDVLFTNTTLFTSPTTVNLKENEEFMIRFSASDVNRDIKNLSIFYDGVLENTTSSLESLNWTYLMTFSDQGTFIVNLTVEDFNSEFDYQEITFIVEDNIPAAVDSITVTNSTLGSELYEGDLYSINVNATDSFDNLVNMTVYREFNNSGIREQICYNQSFISNNYECFASWQTNYSDRGDYNISVELVDLEGLVTYNHSIFSVLPVNRTPIILLAQFAQDGAAYQTVSGSPTFFINETDEFSLLLHYRDENGNNTLDSVSYDVANLYQSISSGIGTTDSINFTTNFSSTGTYPVNITVNDSTGLQSSQLFTIIVINNTPSYFTQFSILDQNSLTDYDEGDNITITVNTTDTFLNGVNVSIYRNSTLLGFCNDVNCSATWLVNFTANGDYNISAVVYDSEGLVNTTSSIISVGVVRIAPTFKQYNITSRYQNKTFIFNPENITCVSGVESNRDCYTSTSLNFSEGDTINVSFVVVDDNGNLTILQGDYFTRAYYSEETVIPLAEFAFDDVTFGSDSYPFNMYERESLDTYYFRTRAGDNSGLDTFLRLNFTIANNVRPVIESLSITNSSGQEGSYFENDVLNITFTASDANLNIQSEEITINGTSYTGTNYVFPLNFSSYGDYEICVDATDLEPLSSVTNCTTIYVSPVNVSPVISQLRVNNGTWIEITNNNEINLLEGNSLIFDIDATDTNGNETISYEITRNGSNQPLTLGTSSDFSFDFNFTQSGYYNITVNLTTDRVDEQVLDWFLLDVRNNTAPRIDAFTLTSNESNPVEQDYVEFSQGYFNFTISDDEQNNQTHYISVYHPAAGETIEYGFNLTYTFSTLQGGSTFDYNVTFFVNDSEGLYAIESQNISVVPKPTAPEIIDAQIRVTNGTVFNVVNGTTYTLFENQNYTFSFNITDVNNNEDAVRIYNGTDWVLTNVTLFTTDYMTATSASTPFTIRYYANDTTGLESYLNFTISVQNNTAPTITQERINGLLYSAYGGTPILNENNTHSFSFSISDVDINIVYANISIERSSTGVFSLINSSTFIDPSSPIVHDEFIPIGVRGTYRYNTTVIDEEGLLTWSSEEFTVDGDNVAPFIENITINSTLFADVVDPVSIYHTQEGDELTISFDSYDIDGDSIDTQSISVINTTSDTNLFPTISSSTGVWSINFTSAGIYEIELRAIDSSPRIGSESIFIQVHNNLAPNITSFTTDNGSSTAGIYYEGDSIDIDFTAIDPNNYSNLESYRIFINDEQVSTGLSHTEVFNYSSAGEYNITVFVNDTGSLNDTENVTITILPIEFSPTFSFEVDNDSGTGFQSILEGETVTIDEDTQLRVRSSATDQNEDFSLSYAYQFNGSDMNGTSVTQTWNIGFDREGPWNITLNVTDDTDRSTIKWFLLDVINNTEPIITAYNITNGTGVGLDTAEYRENDTIVISFSFSDKNEAFHSMKFGAQTFNNDQYEEIELDFASAGVYDYEFYVEDDEGLNATISGNITVLASNKAPVIITPQFDNTSGVVSVVNGSTYSTYEDKAVTFFFDATDVNSDIDTARIFNGTQWLLTNDTTNYYSWEDSGIYAIYYEVNDSQGLTTTLEFILEVINNTEPYIESFSFLNSTGQPGLYEGDEINVGFVYRDNQSNAQTALIYYEDTVYAGNFTTIPLNFTSAGNHTFTFFINDTEGRFTNQSVNVTVQNTTVAPVITEIDLIYGALRYNGSQYNSAANPFNVFSGNILTIEYDFIDVNTDETQASNITVLASPVETSLTQSYIWSIDEEDVGIIAINLTQTDQEGLFDNEVVYVNVTGNTPPVIYSYNVTNSSNNIQLYEGDQLKITYNIGDAQGNINEVQFWENDTLLNTYGPQPSPTRTIELNYTKRGIYNYTIIVVDTNGDNASASVIRNIQAVEITPTIISRFVEESNSAQSFVAEGGVYNLAQNDGLDLNRVNISFLASDLNGNNTLASYQLNGTGFSVSSNSYEWELNYTITGLQRINVSVTDVTGRSNSSYFFINITPNVPSQITSFGWFNSTGGTNISENDTLILNMSTFDPDGNQNSVQIFFDNVLVNSSTLLENLSYTRELSFTDRGEYNVTFVVNDTAGNATIINDTITIYPTNSIPQINYTNVFVTNNMTSITPQQDGQVIIYEGQSVNLSFDAFDLNEELLSFSLFNGTDFISTKQTSIITSFNTTDESELNYTISYYVNDSVSFDEFNFTLTIRNNSAPSIIATDIVGELVPSSSAYQENRSILFNFTYEDPADDYAFANISIFRNMSNTWVYVNSTYEPVSTNLFNFSHFFEINVRGEYLATYRIFDVEGLYSEANQTFELSGVNIAPFIENISVNSTYFGFNSLNASDMFTTQEGDTLIISFDAFDIDENDEVDELTVRVQGQTSQPSPNTWSISYSQSGIYSVRLRAIDNSSFSNTKDQFITINVTDNVAPNITSFIISNETESGLTFREGDTLSFNFTADDANLFNNIDQLKIFVNETQVTTDANTTYSFNYSSEGQYNITAFVNDSGNLFDTETRIITITSVEFDPQLQLIEVNNGTGYVTVNPGDDITVYENRNVSVRLLANDTNEDATFTYGAVSNQTIPFSVISANEFTWNAGWDSDGIWNISVNATDDTLRSVVESLNLTIINNTPPFITSFSFRNQLGNPTIVENDTLIINFTFADNQSNEKLWRIYFEEELLGENITNASKYMNYTSAGAYNITFYVEDDEGRNVTQNQTVTIGNNFVAPIISNMLVSYNGNIFSVVDKNNPPLQVLENVPITFTFEAFDLNADENLTFNASVNTTPIKNSTPEEFDAATVPKRHSFNWRFDYGEAGSRELNATVVDEFGFATSASVYFTVIENTPPQIISFNITNSTGGLNISEGDEFNITYVIYDEEFNIQSVQLSHNNSFSQNYNNDLTENQISYPLNFSQRGSYNFTFNVTDDEGLSNVTSLVVDVNAVERDPVIVGVQLDRSLTGNIFLDETGNNGDFLALGSEIINITFVGSDENGNSTIDSYWIEQNGSIVSTSNNYDFIYPTGEARENFTLFVNDTTGATSNFTFSLINGTNIAPRVFDINVTDSLNPLLPLSEDRIVNITFTAEDNNMKQAVIIFNETIIRTVSIPNMLTNNQYSFLYQIPFQTNGLNNISVNVTDFEGEFGYNYTTVNVLKTSVAPEITSVTVIGNNTFFNPAENETLPTFEGDSVQITYNVFDSNGDVETQLVLQNGSVVGNSPSTINFNYSSEGMYNITLSVNDTDGLVGDNFTFFLNVSANQDPVINGWYALNSTGDIIYNSSNGFSQNVTAGDDLTVYIDAFDPEQKTITYVVEYDNLTYGTGAVSTFTVPQDDFGELSLAVKVSDPNVTTLNATIINVTESANPPSITYISTDSPNIDQENTINNERVSLIAGDTLNMTVFAFDSNGDLNYSRTRYEIDRNNSGVWNGFEPDYIGREYLWFIDFNEVGTYRVTTTIYDDLNNEDTHVMYIDIANNSNPTIASISITNSSNGNMTFVEGDEFNIEVNFTNVLAQYGTFEIRVNDTLVSSSRAGNTLTATYPLSFNSRGDYIIRANVTDGKGASVNITSSVITVVNSEQNPQIIANVSYINGTVINVTHGSSIFAEESAGSQLNILTLNYYVTDPNGDNTVDTDYYRVNDVLYNPINLNYTSEGLYNVTIFANDSTSRQTWLNFTITVINNTNPSLNATFVNETGGNTYIQGDALNVTAQIFDSNKNIESVVLTVNNIAQTFSNVGENYSTLVDLTPYSDESLDVRIRVTDYEGLVNETNTTIYVTATPVPPVISSVELVTAETRFDLYDNETITLYPNASATLIINGYDANGETVTLDTFISSANASSLQENISLMPGQDYNRSTWTQLIVFNQTQIVNFAINLSDGNTNDTFDFIVNITPNVAPVINNVSVLNSNGTNTSYIEGDTISVSINVTDVNNNLVSTSTYANKSIVARVVSSNQYIDQNYTWELDEDVTNFTFVLPGFSEPNITLNITARDSLGLQTSVQYFMNITKKNFPVDIENATAVRGSFRRDVSNGLVLAAFNPGDQVVLSFQASDKDLDVDTAYITVAANKRNGTSYTFNVPSNSAGNTYNVTYFINDSTGFEDSINFQLLIIEKEQPQSGSSGSSGSSRSSSSTTPVPPPIPEIEINNPRPVIIAQNQEIFDTIWISNSGTKDLSNVLITPQFNNKDFEIEILDTILNLSANTSIPVRVRYKNNGSLSPFEVNFSVEGKDVTGRTVTTDKAVLYINSLASDFTDESESDYRTLLEYVRTLVLDNVECLGLVDTVSRGEQAYRAGDTPLAMDYLRTARDDCLSADKNSVQSINTNILERDSSIRNLILQILMITFILLLIPSLYIYYRKRRGRKKGDAQEQEIENLLKEFYET